MTRRRRDGEEKLFGCSESVGGGQRAGKGIGPRPMGVRKPFFSRQAHPSWVPVELQAGCHAMGCQGSRIKILMYISTSSLLFYPDGQEVRTYCTDYSVLLYRLYVPGTAPPGLSTDPSTPVRG